MEKKVKGLSRREVLMEEAFVATLSGAGVPGGIVKIRAQGHTLRPIRAIEISQGASLRSALDAITSEVPQYRWSVERLIWCPYR